MRRSADHDPVIFLMTIAICRPNRLSNLCRFCEVGLLLTKQRRLLARAVTRNSLVRTYHWFSKRSLRIFSLATKAEAMPQKRRPWVCMAQLINLTSAHLSKRRNTLNTASIRRFSQYNFDFAYGSSPQAITAPHLISSEFYCASATAPIVKSCS